MPKLKKDPKTQLTPRQRNLLFAVVREYCEFGNTVSSGDLKDKYGFEFSPATIRNEFTVLRELSYLYQPFTNSSSQPTEKAFKLFINQLIVGLQVTSRQQQDLKRQIQHLENQQGNLQKEISRLLALETNGVGFSLSLGSENVAGIKHLIEHPGEGQVADILDFLDNLDHHKQYLLEHKSAIWENSPIPAGGKKGKQNLKTIFAGDTPIVPLGKGYAMVATEIMLGNEKTVVGLISPTHLLARKKNLEVIHALAQTFEDKDKEISDEVVD